MQEFKIYRILFPLTLIGAAISFIRCVMLEFYSWALSVGGHGGDVVVEVQKSSNLAERLFFLTIGLIVSATWLRYRMKKIKAKDPAQT